MHGIFLSGLRASGLLEFVMWNACVHRQGVGLCSHLKDRGKAASADTTRLLMLHQCLSTSPISHQMRSPLLDAGRWSTDYQHMQSHVHYAWELL